ncbi:HIT family protein [Stackebrandtia soli]|uniref:HIT family protein n=1 Tax=Stackebrandtia soli TaxID=1892856 RepID=UPI0039E897BA
MREMAVAIRRLYGCEGVTTRQNNEPAGNQDVWHLHVHVIPRYPGDGLYRSNPRQYVPTAEERRVYTDRLRAYFATGTTDRDQGSIVPRLPGRVESGRRGDESAAAPSDPRRCRTPAGSVPIRSYRPAANGAAESSLSVGYQEMSVVRCALT